jgi:hypothetical protein
MLLFFYSRLEEGNSHSFMQRLVLCLGVSRLLCICDTPSTSSTRPVGFFCLYLSVRDKPATSLFACLSNPLVMFV